MAPYRAFTPSLDNVTERPNDAPKVVEHTSGGSMPEQAIILGFKASNNEAEYEALLAGLRMIKNLAVKSFQFIPIPS